MGPIFSLGSNLQIYFFHFQAENHVMTTETFFVHDPQVITLLEVVYACYAFDK